MENIADSGYAKKLMKQNALKDHFGITDEDLSYLWKLFMEYGMTLGEAKHRSPANHYFLQGICEHNIVEYNEWKPKMTIELKGIIAKKYPQLMVNCRKYKLH